MTLWEIKSVRRNVEFSMKIKEKHEEINMMEAIIIENIDSI